jgi:large subunit ribosomal protein L7/L12
MSDEATKIELNKEEMAVIEALEKLNIVSVNNVVKYMEAEYGISAAPAMGMMMPAAGGAAAGGEAAEEKTSFTVQLKDAGAQKIGVIKSVRELTGLGLKEAKDIVDQNGKVMENVDKAKAEEAKKALEAAGAKVELV